MRQLSKTDQAFFKSFKEKYPGWEILRYEDNSLEFVQPKREYVKKIVEKRNIFQST